MAMVAEKLREDKVHDGDGNEETNGDAVSIK
jgi:hypothetical protein